MSEYDWSDLKELYIDKQLSCGKIAEIKGCPRIKVYKILIKMGIPTRTRLESKHYSKYDWSDLQELYLNKRLTAREISEIKHCCLANVSYMLRKMNIPTRTHTEQLNLSYEKGRKTRYPRTNTGHKRLRTDGYILIQDKEHHRAGRDGYILEHIYVWERVHNEKLPDNWHIHHLNGIKGDNRPQNLVAISPRKHRARHITLDDYRKQRIRELEEENRLLRKAMEDGQMIFTIEEN